MLCLRDAEAREKIAVESVGDAEIVECLLQRSADSDKIFRAPPDIFCRLLFRCILQRQKMPAGIAAVRILEKKISAVP